MRWAVQENILDGAVHETNEVNITEESAVIFRHYESSVRTNKIFST